MSTKGLELRQAEDTSFLSGLGYFVGLERTTREQALADTRLEQLATMSTPSDLEESRLDHSFGMRCRRLSRPTYLLT
jgi:hypothetical protein